MAARSNEDLLLDYRTEQAKGEAHGLYLAMLKSAQAAELPSLNWQAYMRRATEEMERSLNEEHSPTRIVGVPAGSTETELLDQFREFALGWAAAIEAWPAMRAIIR